MAEATGVKVDGIGWLELTWNRGKSGRVEMRYGGKTFYVQADLDAGVRDCSDTYQEQEFVEAITSIMRDELSCERLCASMDFGVGNTLHYLGIDVRTIDDLLAKGDIDVRVSAYGLDPSQVASFDTTRLGANPKIGIYCWKDPSIVEAGYTPQNSVNLADSDTIGLTDHCYFLGGAWTCHPYVQYEDDMVAFAYRADLGVQIARTTVDGDLYAYRHYKNSVHCNTFDRDIGGVDVDWRLVGHSVPEGLLEEYVRRLHGRSPWDDMLLAGMVKDVNDPSTPMPFKELVWPNGSRSSYYDYEDSAHGIGFNGKETSSTFKGDVILYCDGALRKGMTVWNDGKNLTFPDDPNNKHWSFPILYFEFA